MALSHTITLEDGTLVLVEKERHPGLDRRGFRQRNGFYEWAHLADIEANGVRARFYGFGDGTTLPESFYTEAA